MVEKKGIYYTHIDALRAFAVLTVILFHVDPKYLPGGFIGVDVFFVISGFLISTQLFNAVSSNTFSIRQFYANRIKRILPAAFSVIFITIFLAQILFLPEDATKVAESGVWSSLSLSNVYFWLFQDTGYFASASETIPLLHYWSLGVEEQFYIFWPLIVLILLPKINSSLFIGILIFTILMSATIAQIMLRDHHSFVYYMLPSRAGELLVGALLAALLHYNLISKPSGNSLWFLVSLITLLGSCLFISPNMIFPGWLYLLPTVSAALFIWSGFNQSSHLYTWVTRKYILRLGKISYSAYLVHWPILAFYRYGYGEPTLVVKFALIVVIIISAALNWKYVEEKFRYVDFSLRRLVALQVITPILIIALLASEVIATKGFGIRILSNKYVDALTLNSNDAIPPNKYDYICQYWELKSAHFDDTNCVIGDNPKVDVLLWGDSNAAHYIGIVGSIAKAQNWSFRNASHASCPPIFNEVRHFVKASRYQDCKNSIALVRSKLKAFNTVIISAAYDTYYLRDNNFMTYFEKTLQTLVSEDKRVIILGEAAVFEELDRHCLSKSLIYPFRDCFNVQRKNEQEIKSINDRLAQFAEATKNVEYIDFNAWLCNGICSPYRNGKPIYFDASHLEILASWQFGKNIVEQPPIKLKINLYAK